MFREQAVRLARAGSVVRCAGGVRGLGSVRTARIVLVALCMLAGVVRPVEAQHAPEHGLKMMEWSPTLFVLFDQLEYLPRAGERPVSLEMTSWYGGSRKRVWVRARAEQSTVDRTGEGEAELLYGRLVDPFWDAIIGVRVDREWEGAGSGRVHAAVGFMGLAPYRFELSPTLYVSTKGDISARLEAGYQLLLTQHLIAEPEFELNAGLQSVPEAGLGRGLQDYELGLRVRYEIRREFAPYVGWSWERRLGGTADFVRAERGSVGESSFVVGVRVWR